MPTADRRPSRSSFSLVTIRILSTSNPTHAHGARRCASVGVGEAYKRTRTEVRSDIGLLDLLGAVSEPECDRLVTAITAMDSEVAFRLASVDLDYNKVLGVIASAIVAILFILG